MTKYTEYKESEIIELAKKLNLIDGTETETKFYKEKGYIPADSSLDTFVKKLQCGFTKVKLKLNPNSNKGKGDKPFTGKKRIYLIGTQRKEFLEYTDNSHLRGRRSLSENEEELMNAILSNIQYYKLKGQVLTVKQWLGKLGFSQKNVIINKENHKRPLKLLNEFFALNRDYGAHFYHPEILLTEFCVNYNRLLESTLKRHFEWLQKEGLIQYQLHYRAVDLDNTFAINKETYNEFHSLRKELITHSGYTFKEFQQLEQRVKYWKKEKAELNQEQREIIQVIQQVQRELLKQTGFKYVFEAIQVTQVVSNDTPILAPKKRLKELYEDYLIHTTKINRHKTKKNSNTIWHESTYFHKAFFYLATSILLERPDENEINNFEYDLELYMRRDYVRRCMPFRNKSMEELIYEDNIVEIVSKEFERVWDYRMNKIKRLNEPQYTNTNKALFLEELKSIELYLTN